MLLIQRSFFLCFIPLQLVFFIFLYTVCQDDSYLSIFKLVDPTTWDQVNENSLLDSKRVEFLFDNFID